MALRVCLSLAFGAFWIIFRYFVLSTWYCVSTLCSLIAVVSEHLSVATFKHFFIAKRKCTCPIRKHTRCNSYHYHKPGILPLKAPLCATHVEVIQIFAVVFAGWQLRFRFIWPKSGIRLLPLIAFVLSAPTFSEIPSIPSLLMQTYVFADPSMKSCASVVGLLS